MKKFLSKPDIAVVGLYHLGSVVSIGLASLGKQVIGIDLDKSTTLNLSKTKVPLYEPGLEELLKKFKENIFLSSDFSLLKSVQTVFFTQDSETDGSGSIKKLKHLIDQSIPYLKENVTIIIMSQVPLGFHKELILDLNYLRPNLKFTLYHWVDTIIMTKAIDRFLNPERIIIGLIDSKNMSPNLENLLKIFKCPVYKMSFESAEITKAAINLYLATSVTFANTLASFCEQFGGDIAEIIPALQSDKRIGPYSYIKPTLRISGGHLERDLFMLQRLAKKRKISEGIVKFIIDQNKSRYKWVIKKIGDLSLNSSRKKTICFWGLAYKKDSSSTENAASLLLIKSLSKKFNIRVYDPLAIMPKNLKGYKRFSDKYQALAGSDVLIILTDWDEFKKVDLNKINVPVIDCVRVLDPSKIKNYLGLGKTISF